MPLLRSTHSMDVLLLYIKIHQKMKCTSDNKMVSHWTFSLVIYIMGTPAMLYTHIYWGWGWHNIQGSGSLAANLTVSPNNRFHGEMWLLWHQPHPLTPSLPLCPVCFFFCFFFHLLGSAVWYTTLHYIHSTPTSPFRHHSHVICYLLHFQFKLHPLYPT